MASFRRRSSFDSLLSGAAEDALLCFSLVFPEVIIVLDRGSITGTIGRGLEPNEALRDTWDGQERFERTGPLELKRPFAREESA